MRTISFASKEQKEQLAITFAKLVKAKIRAGILRSIDEAYEEFRKFRGLNDDYTYQFAVNTFNNL